MKQSCSHNEWSTQASWRLILLLASLLGYVAPMSAASPQPLRNFEGHFQEAIGFSDQAIPIRLGGRAGKIEETYWGWIEDGRVHHSKYFTIDVPTLPVEHRWVRESWHWTDQFEVQFGDDGCRRFYARRIGGDTGRRIGEDRASFGDEAVLRAVASQFAARRGEREESAAFRESKYGPVVVARTSDSTGWPCVSHFPSGGQTVAVSFYHFRDGALFEVGYQVGLTQEADRAAARAAAEEHARNFFATLVFAPPVEKLPRFPWGVEDPPPLLAGFSLGDSLQSVEREIGKAEFENDSKHWVARAPGLEIRGTDGGVWSIDVSRRNAGHLAGIRVGDSVAKVIEQWGSAATGGDLFPESSTFHLVYYTARWHVLVWFKRYRVANLAIGPNASDMTPYEYVPDVGPLPEPGAPMPEARRISLLPPAEQIFVGDRFELPPGALTNFSGEYVYQDSPNKKRLSIRIDDILATSPVLPGSSQAKERLADLLKSEYVTIEFVSVVREKTFGRTDLTGRLSIRGRDIGLMLVDEGWALAGKSRSGDLRRFAAEAHAKEERRGLWGLPPMQSGESVVEYLESTFSRQMRPETYVQARR